jgi:hypothetical protein
MAGPAQPSESRKKRVDRDSASQFATAVRRLGFASLDACARFLSRNPNADPDSAMQIWLWVMCSPVSFDLEGDPPELFQLYDGFSPVQRGGLLRGERIGLSGFTPAQAELARRLVYESGRELGRLAPQGVNPGAPDEELWDFDFNRGSLEMEATEVFPTGLPATAFFSIKAEPELVAVPDSAIMFEIGFSAERLASNALSRERQIAQGLTPRAEPKYRPATSVKYVFTLNLGGGLGITGYFEELRVDRSLPFVPFESLPEEILAKYRESLKKLREEAAKEPPPPPDSPHKAVVRTYGPT